MNDKITGFVVQEVLRRARGFRLSESDREDLVQTALLKILRAKYPLERMSEAQVLSLARTVVTKLVIDDWRRKCRRQRAYGCHVQIATELVSEEDASGRLEQQERRKVVLEALVDALDVRERRVVYDRFFLNKRLAEIAGHMGMPVSTVHATLTRALRKLSVKLRFYEDAL